jgi:putative acetyltransferase
MSTKQVLIRAVEADDWEDLAVVFNCPDVIYYSVQQPYVSRDAMRDQLENLPADFQALVAVVDERIIGQIALQLGTGRRAHSARISLMLHSDYQDQGIDVALLESGIDLLENWLNISRLELKVFPDNTAALDLYKKFNFEVEGTLHDAVYRDGQFTDLLLMARLKDKNQ